MCESITVEQARDNALAVFSGRVISSEYRDTPVVFQDGKPQKELTVRFKVERWWKGYDVTEVFLFTEQYQAVDFSISVSDCAIQFEAGKRYLVYANFFFDRLRASYCSRTAVLERAKEDLKILNRLESKTEKAGPFYSPKRNKRLERTRR